MVIELVGVGKEVSRGALRAGLVGVARHRSLARAAGRGDMDMAAQPLVDKTTPRHR
jgi:hypothetical protein